MTADGTDAHVFRSASDAFPIDTARLGAYLAGVGLPLDPSEPVKQFGTGMANINYRLRAGGRMLVLRRPPDGDLPPGAHDMAREHRILSRLWRALPLAPESVPVSSTHRSVPSSSLAPVRSSVTIPAPTLRSSVDAPVRFRVSAPASSKPSTVAWYAPDNAVLTIAGDFDAAEARAMVERHFGAVARGGARPPLGEMSVPDTFGAWRREVVPDAVAPVALARPAPTGAPPGSLPARPGLRARHGRVAAIPPEGSKAAS